MPFVAVAAHRMLGDLAAIRLALHLLDDANLSDEQRAKASASLTLRLDALEDGLKELITAPRDEPAT